MVIETCRAVVCRGFKNVVVRRLQLFALCFSLSLSFTRLLSPTLHLFAFSCLQRLPLLQLSQRFSLPTLSQYCGQLVRLARLLELSWLR